MNLWLIQANFNSHWHPKDNELMDVLLFFFSRCIFAQVCGRDYSLELIMLVFCFHKQSLAEKFAWQSRRCHINSRLFSSTYAIVNSLHIQIPEKIEFIWTEWFYFTFTMCNRHVRRTLRSLRYLNSCHSATPTHDQSWLSSLIPYTLSYILSFYWTNVI